mmetsp:Transcript_36813/g.59529  ORF Transcript_36813/g.59529 Transcript_36813/m.59529 type:complete len:123 (+) Transcript_36813:956-1324(+)
MGVRFVPIFFRGLGFLTSLKVESAAIQSPVHISHNSFLQRLVVEVTYRREMDDGMKIELERCDALESVVIEQCQRYEINICVKITACPRLTSFIVSEMELAGPEKERTQLHFDGWLSRSYRT